MSISTRAATTSGPSLIACSVEHANIELAEVAASHNREDTHRLQGSDSRIAGVDLMDLGERASSLEYMTISRLPGSVTRVEPKCGPASLQPVCLLISEQ